MKEYVITEEIYGSWLLERPERLKWFLDLYFNSKNMEISLKTLASRWGITKSAVRYFLQQAEAQGLLVYKGTKIKVNGQDKESIEEKQKRMQERKEEFYKSLIPFVEEYGKDMVRKFFDYWSEPNKSQTKMKFELEKTFSLKLRLKTWQQRKYGKSNNQRGFDEAVEQYNRLQSAGEESQGADGIGEIQGGNILL